MAFADCNPITPPVLTAAQICEGFAKCGSPGLRLNASTMNAVFRYFETTFGVDKVMTGNGAFDTATETQEFELSDGTSATMDFAPLIAYTVAQAAAFEKFLVNGGTYAPATNLFTFPLNDGTTATADFGPVIADAVAAAVTAVGPEKYITAWQSYDSTTDVATLLLSDGTTTTIDFTDLINDAVASALAQILDTSATQRGVVNLTAMQSLGAGDKVINGVRIGRGAGGAGADNTVVGNNAGGAFVAPFAITLMGQSAGAALTSQAFVTAVGNGAAQTTTQSTGSYFGARAGQNDAGAQSAAFGFGALQNNTGTFSSAFGSNAMTGNTGGRSVGVGFTAGETNTGVNATLIGAESGRYNKAGFVSVLGQAAGQRNGGAELTAIGQSAGGLNAGANNTVIGSRAALSVSAADFTALGFQAGAGVIAGTAQAVTAVDVATNRITVAAHGYGAAGARVALILAGALPAGALPTDVFTVIDANVVEFMASDITTAGGAFTVARNTINNSNNSTAVGANSNVTAANQVMLGSAATVEVRTSGAFFGTAFNIVSDARNKVNVRDVALDRAIEFSRKVGFKTFGIVQSFASAKMADAMTASAFEMAKQPLPTEMEKLKTLKKPTKADRERMAEIDKRLAETPPPSKSRARLGDSAGVIAQEVEALCKELGAFEFLVTTNAVTGEKTVDYTALLAVVSCGLQARMERAGL